MATQMAKAFCKKPLAMYDGCETITLAWPRKMTCLSTVQNISGLVSFGLGQQRGKNSIVWDGRICGRLHLCLGCTCCLGLGFGSNA